MYDIENRQPLACQRQNFGGICSLCSIRDVNVRIAGSAALVTHKSPITRARTPEFDFRKLKRTTRAMTR
jgi:hypothetical protein